MVSSKKRTGIQSGVYIHRFDIKRTGRDLGIYFAFFVGTEMFGI